jgi:hypothetical protein
LAAAPLIGDALDYALQFAPNGALLRRVRQSAGAAAGTVMAIAAAMAGSPHSPLDVEAVVRINQTLVFASRGLIASPVSA